MANKMTTKFLTLNQNFVYPERLLFFERLMGFFLSWGWTKSKIHSHVDVRKDTALCISTNYLYYLLIIILSHLLSFILRFGVCWSSNFSCFWFSSPDKVPGHENIFCELFYQIRYHNKIWQLWSTTVSGMLTDWSKLELIFFLLQRNISLICQNIPKEISKYCLNIFLRTSWIYHSI